MVVYFTKDSSNYNQQNIIDILSVINNNLIQYLLRDPVNYILVEGDIHRSQWTSDNPQNYFWLKIKGFIDDIPVPELRAAHVYLCFREQVFDRNTGQYIYGTCFNPEGRTDVADISNRMGYWQFVKITYGLSPKSASQDIKRKPIKRAASKALIKIDPKTGKVVAVGGGSKKEGGAKPIQYKFKKYSKTTERVMSLLRKRTKRLFKEIDWKNDIKAGEKFEKGSNKIVSDFLNSIIEKRSNGFSLNILDEVEQAIKNEYPTAYEKTKGKEIKKAFQELKRFIKSPKRGGSHHNKKSFKSTTEPKKKVKKVIKKSNK